MVLCKECEREFDSLDSLRRHRSQKHGVNAEQTYIDYVLDGVEPKCKCGCGEKPNFLSLEKGFVEYILGHASRVNNNWGHNPEAIKKSHETQKKMHESGELTIWNKGLTKNDDVRIKNYGIKIGDNIERADKISLANLGVKKSEPHKEKLKETAQIRWADINEREKQRFRRLDYFKNRQFNKKTILEAYFESLLTKLGVEFETQHPVNGYLFDIYIENKNLLIEVDGDWYHCNPKIHPEAKSVIQKQVVSNDIRKNKVASDNNFKLLRFWESDINNDVDSVILRLKKELNL